RYDAELDCGRHSEVVAELRDLVASAPLHEGFWRTLMLALFRSGRRSDALAAYGDARRVLLDELGLDPSPETVRLHASILADDPALIGQAATGAVASSIAIKPLDPRPAKRARTRFVGRQRDVLEVVRLLQSVGSVTISGPGGVGKTRLALEIADRGASDY